MPEEQTPAERAVEKFDQAQSALQEFMEENHELVDELRSLVEDYNASLSEATVAVKSELKNSDRNRLVIGQIGVTRKSRSFWDGTKLATLVRANICDLFLQEQVSYEVDVKKLEQLIRQGEVDQEVARQAWVQKPDTLALMPGCPKELRF